MKKIVLIILTIGVVTATAAMAESELKYVAANNEVQNNTDFSLEKDRNSKSSAEAINIEVLSIKITILSNSSFNRQNAIVSASIENKAPGETFSAD